MTVRAHFPREVANAIVNDRRWPETADRLNVHYTDHGRLATAMEALAGRLGRTPTTATWLSGAAYAPARWLARNLLD